MMIKQIPGLDTENGLALYGDDTEIYLAVLRSYVLNALEVTEKLKLVSKDTLPDYAIKVHGLKGISAGIGALKIMKAAAQLEELSKSGEMDGVLKANESLVKDTEELVSRIQAWLLEHDSKTAKPLLPCPCPLQLKRLLECCRAYDMSGVDDIMAELEAADYENDSSLVTWLRERVNESDLSAVAEKLCLRGEEQK